MKTDSIIADIQREHVRNRLLRRADWRFLLADPEPARSICFADGDLAAAVALISGLLVEAEQLTAKDCDLAVAIDPRQDVIESAWTALRPGGWCYTEWYSPLAGGTLRVRRRLEAAGFDTVECYWAWPWPTHGSPQYWLPLDVPGPLHYFLSSRPADRNVFREAARAGLRAVWRLSVLLRLTLPICAIAHKPVAFDKREQPASPSTRDTEVGSPFKTADGRLLDTILANWAGWGLGVTPSKLAWLLLTGGGRSINKIVGLLFAEAERRPRLAVKIARVPESTAALSREADILRQIETQQPGVSGVPRGVFLLERDGLTALGETVLHGQPLWRLLNPENYRRLALQATDWLADLVGNVQPRPPAEWWNRLIDPVIAKVQDSFGAILDGALLRDTIKILHTLSPLPLVCEQRDFSPWNVLVDDRGELVVLDWESAEPHGLPGMDLIYFQTYLAFFLTGAMNSGELREAYRATLDRSSVTGRVIAECAERYACRTGIAMADLDALRMFVWLVHARSEYRQFVSDTGGRPSPELLRRSLFISLWEEELRVAHHGKARGN
ncbi:MAG TPA: phosphotransferase [Roseiflexaceae bacterium]|nr:phosphotransferase [Roseiflexaceae bacterium]